jgi:hypothetical protein
MLGHHQHLTMMVNISLFIPVSTEGIGLYAAIVIQIKRISKYLSVLIVMSIIKPIWIKNIVELITTFTVHRLVTIVILPGKIR